MTTVFDIVHRTAKAEYIKLDELGNPVFNGTTHMMMLGTNNLDVADVILKMGRCQRDRKK